MACLLCASSRSSRRVYKSCADVFLCDSGLAKRVVNDAFDVLELRYLIQFWPANA
ncbi:hypothetical protein OG298_44320 (plasmid) [Streptomyces sp. NBC_01005]|uniref:hypothetical protein n=1 Tax=unclassified Streptomyces TaxID=2593676 RepID=UPI002F90EB86|nr:hypothetical protein OG298_44320 [Streptomyces sp. NBC_01005]WTD00756.1 hypothetical protein OH736_44325 [Streptomyces sp. NBC_01650]